jgi:hypothetical protein
MSDYKTCTHCKEIKALEDYYKNKKNTDGKDCVCKDCRAIKSWVRYTLNTAMLIEAKYKPCHSCGKVLHPSEMDLHHVDPSTKEFNTSYSRVSRSKKKLLNEINKCVPVCRPCHRKIHHGN